MHITKLTVTDCGAPFAASGVVIGPFNDTKFGATPITFHCEEDEVQSMTSLCSSNGEWIPDPNLLECGAPYSTTSMYIVAKAMLMCSI